MSLSSPLCDSSSFQSKSYLPFPARSSRFHKAQVQPPKRGGASLCFYSLPYEMGTSHPVCVCVDKTGGSSVCARGCSRSSAFTPSLQSSQQTSEKRIISISILQMCTQMLRADVPSSRARIRMQIVRLQPGCLTNYPKLPPKPFINKKMLYKLKSIVIIPITVLSWGTCSHHSSQRSPEAEG